MYRLILLPIVAVALAAARTPVTSAPVASGTYTIGVVHSSVTFRVLHANATNFYGVFKQISGEFTVDAQKPEDNKVSVRIATDSIDTRDEKRDNHLRSPDFFDAKQFPDITFTSSKVTNKGNDLEVTGTLELHGKKKEMTLAVKKTGEGEFQGKVVGYETSFTVKRSDFGMSYGIAKKVLGDDVQVTIAVEASPKK